MHLDEDAKISFMSTFECPAEDKQGKIPPPQMRVLSQKPALVGHIASIVISGLE